MLIAEESISRNPLLQLPEKNTLDILGTTTIIAQTKIGSNSVNINLFLPIFVDVFCEKRKPQDFCWLIVRGFLLYHLFENIFFVRFVLASHSAAHCAAAHVAATHVAAAHRGSIVAGLLCVLKVVVLDGVLSTFYLDVLTEFVRD